jgi:signal transduction histidine kinase
MTHRRLLLRAAFGGCALACLAAAVLWLSQSLDPATEARFRGDVRQVGIVAAQVEEDLLRAHSGIVSHYDDLARHQRQLRHLLSDLELPPAALGFELGPDFAERLGHARELAALQRRSIERFESDHAVLRNSRQYFPVLLEEVKQRVPPGIHPRFEQAVTHGFEALAHFDVLPPKESSGRLQAALAEIESAGPGLGDPQLNRRLELLQRHGRTILERRAAVSDGVRASLDIPLAREALELYDSYAARQRAASLASRSWLSYVMILGFASISLGLTELVLRLQSSRAELRRTSAELERANHSLEQERQKERELGELKTRFVSATAHEFKNPLTTILSSSEMLEAYAARWDEARRSLHFQRIRAAALRMTEMLDEVLLIGRAEAGVLVPVPEELNLTEFCESLLQGLERSPGARERVRMTCSGAEWVRLDQRLLSHVLGNLLDNALKYSPPESPVLLDLSVNDTTLTCTLEDRGIGIPEQDLPQLFVSFQRASNVGTVQGSGLGLAVVKRAVETQHGTVRVQSELGRGTKFIVQLPLAEPASNDALPLLALPSAE